MEDIDKICEHPFHLNLGKNTKLLIMASKKMQGFITFHVFKRNRKI